MPTFGVIVCLRCREHAQIIELGGAKKTRCQKCGASLEIRKLRLLYSSDNLEEAVSARTLLQARVHNLEEEMKSQLPGETLAEEERIRSTPVEPQIDQADLRDTRQIPKKSPRQIILKLLRSKGGQMETTLLESLAKEHGINEQQLETILEKMKSAGEIYQPSPYMLCLAE